MPAKRVAGLKRRMFEVLGGIAAHPNRSITRRERSLPAVVNETTSSSPAGPKATPSASLAASVA